MILPTKRISQDRALLSVGADVLHLLEEPRTVSSLWEALQALRGEQRGAKPITYDWFALGLDFLYAIRVIEMEQGRLYRVTHDTSRV